MTTSFDARAEQELTAVAAYRTMSLIRHFEQKLLDLFQRGELSGTTHTCVGQEATAVGVVAALDVDRDVVWSNHRAHGHFLAYCGLVEPLLAELLGRSTGVCGGRGGTQHLHHRNFYSNGIQGGIVPNAVGSAFAIRDSGAIAAVFLGDGTMGEGVVYESLNLASLWDVPVLFVVEDNGIAQTTPKRLGVAGDIARRAEPFGVRCFYHSGTQVLDLHRVAREAVGYVRSNRRPAWLHVETVRLGPHSKGDDTRGEEELGRLRELDPLAAVRPLVRDWKLIDADAVRRIEEALTSARRAPLACG